MLLWHVLLLAGCGLFLFSIGFATGSALAGRAITRRLSGALDYAAREVRAANCRTDLARKASGAALTAFEFECGLLTQENHQLKLDVAIGAAELAESRACCTMLADVAEDIREAGMVMLTQQQAVYAH